MKKLISVSVLVLIFIFSVIPVFSALTANVLDEAGVFSAEQAQRLQEKIDDINKDAEFTTYAITVDDIDTSTIEAFSEKYQKQHDLDDNCVFMIISMGSRDVDICAHGKGENALDQNRREEVYEDMYDYLHSGSYYQAYDIFLDGVKKYSKPYVSPSWIFIALVAGFLISLIISNSLKKQLKTVEFQRDARPYVRPGSMNLRNSRDQFLYFTVNRVAKPKDNGGKGGMHSSGGGGGSFGHTSGKF